MLARTATTAIAAALLSGCAIHQKITPVEKFDSNEVCIIENTAVKETFLDAYRNALTAKNYVVKKLPAASSFNDCAITSTYTANWRWDLALYMAYAEIKVYNNAKPSGQATYDSLRGGANMGKFIDAEAKITELVNALFPEQAAQ